MVSPQETARAGQVNESHQELSLPLRIKYFESVVTRFRLPIDRNLAVLGVSKNLSGDSSQKEWVEVLLLNGAANSLVRLNEGRNEDLEFGCFDEIFLFFALCRTNFDKLGFRRFRRSELLELASETRTSLGEDPLGRLLDRRIPALEVRTEADSKPPNIKKDVREQMTALDIHALDAIYASLPKSADSWDSVKFILSDDLIRVLVWINAIARGEDYKEAERQISALSVVAVRRLIGYYLRFMDQHKIVNLEELYKRVVESKKIP